MIFDSEKSGPKIKKLLNFEAQRSSDPYLGACPAECADPAEALEFANSIDSFSTLRTAWRQYLMRAPCLAELGCTLICRRGYAPFRCGRLAWESLDARYNRCYFTCLSFCK